MVHPYKYVGVHLDDRLAWAAYKRLQEGPDPETHFYVSTCGCVCCIVLCTVWFVHVLLLRRFRPGINNTSVFSLKVIFSKGFILFSFVAPLVIICNSRCVFGPHFTFSFLVCCRRAFLCLFGRSNRLLTTLTETRKNSTPLHTQVS